MSDRLSLRELAESDARGTWVGASHYGGDLPSEEHVEFLVQRARSDRWTLSVRGYEEGGRLDSVLSTGEMAVNIGGSIYPALDIGHSVITVDAETGERYAEAIKAPEIKTNLLAQVLEDPPSGSGWDVLGPSEYNDYEKIAQLVILETGAAGLAWAQMSEGDDMVEAPCVGPPRLQYGTSLDSSIVRDGPLARVQPISRAVYGLASSAVADRVAHFPLKVVSNPDLSLETVPEPDKSADLSVGIIFGVR